jgi:hypothetical protein
MPLEALIEKQDKSIIYICNSYNECWLIRALNVQSEPTVTMDAGKYGGEKVSW